VSERTNFAVLFDRYAQIINFAANNKRRIGSKDVSNLLDASQRSAQRYLIQLEQQGYLVSDGAHPIGYTPSVKAKKIFMVTA